MIEQTGMPARGSRARPAAQRGQALAEALAALSAMLLVYAALARVGAWQESASRASQASRHAAFLATRGAPMPADPASRTQMDRSRRLSESAQAGAQDSWAARLGQEWALQDGGIVRMAVTVQAPAWASPVLPAVAGAGQPAPAPEFERQTAILADDGHGSGDRAVQQRVGRSATAWGQAAGRSLDIGRAIGAGLEGVDAPWGRPAPDFDWLEPWAGRVPDRYLRAAGSGMPGF